MEGNKGEKKDCILYNIRVRACGALDKTYCKDGKECGFYKSDTKYYPDGSKR